MSGTFGETSKAEWVAVAGPEVEIVDDSQSGSGRELVLRLKSPRRANEIQLLIAREAGLQSMMVESREVVLSTSAGTRLRLPEHDVLSVITPPGKDVTVTLRLESAEAHEHLLVDVSHGLPSSGNDLVEARAPLGSPAHRGDQRIVYRSVRF